MTKTLVDISPHIISKLDSLAKQCQSSRSALIRKAIDLWIKDQTEIKTGDVFGILKDHPLDILSFQRKMRDEW